MMLLLLKKYALDFDLFHTCVNDLPPGGKSAFQMVEIEDSARVQYAIFPLNEVF